MAGGKIDILVNPDVKDFPGKLESGLQGSLATAGKIGAALGLSIGAAATAKSVFDLGVAFDKQMNTMAAVSQASAAQLEAVGEKARELGKSTDLTATSASDAAAAMTELVKGGFSVQESMDAAKGTLQLASAAQIDAAAAATIQSQALQAFGLDASYAATASDVLAGAANASSAEIEGIAQGLQQSGAVANQFGLSIEDNATALAMFANAGIQGSDAGTLLKSALLALTDQGKPAQEAIEALGLSVYDAQGKFVGMETLFGQLNDAAARMTDEQYQAATATLFGSDAMRLAGIAAREGSEGWTATYDAVTRAGQAAEVAAAQAQGLPGVLEAIENQAEDTGIAVYDAFKDIALGTGQGLVSGIEAAGPVIEAAASEVAAFIEFLGPGLAAGADAAGTAVGQVVDVVGVLGQAVKSVGGDIASFLGPVASGLGDVTGGLSSFAGPAAAAAAALGVAKWKNWGGVLETAGGSMKKNTVGILELARLHEAMATKVSGSAKVGKELGDVQANTAVTARGLSSALQAQVPWIGRAAEMYRTHGAELRTSAANHRRWADEISVSSGEVHTLAANMHRGHAALDRFNGTLVGGFAAGASVARSAVGGLIDALGGPWNVAIAAATFAVTGITSEIAKTRESKQLMEDLAQASETTGRALFDAMSQGDVGAQITALNEGLASLIDKQAQIAETAPGAFSIFAAAGKDIGGWFTGKGFNAGTDERRAQQEAAREAEAFSEAIEKAGISAQEAATAVGGTAAQYDELISRLDLSTEGGQAAADALAQQRDEFQRMQALVDSLAPGSVEMSEALATIGDEAADSKDKVAALSRALDDIFGVQRTGDEALAELHEQIEQITESAQEAVDQSKGFGEALFGGDGGLDMSKANARELQAEILGMRSSLEQVAIAGEDVDAAFDSQQPALQALGDRYGLSKDRVDELAASMGLVPSTIKSTVDVATDPAIKGLAEVWTAIQKNQVEAGKPVELKVANIDETTKQLEDLGWKVDELTRNEDGSGAIEVTADTAEAIAELDMLIAAYGALDEDKSITITSNSEEEIDGLAALGFAIEKVGDGEYKITSNTPEEIEYMIELGLLVKDPKTGQVTITDNIQEVLNRGRELDRRDGKRTRETHEVIRHERTVRDITYAQTAGGTRPITGYMADGAVRTAASGLLSEQQAQIARGGSWLVWAEDETQGESFIPHAPAKRARATQIMAATADIFGLGLVDADGNRITRDGTPVGPLASGNVRTFAGGGIVESITGLVRQHFPMMTITSTYRNTNDHHGAGKAVDFSNGFDTTPEMQQAARFFHQNYGNQLAELIHWPLNGWNNIKNGAPLNYGEPTNSQHRNHVHIAAHAPLGAPGTTEITAGMQGTADSLSAGDTAVGPYSYQSHALSERSVDWGEAGDLNQRARRYLGVYDQGGWLPSGGMAVNLGSKPEPVFSPPQWSLLQRAIDSLPALIDALRSGDTARARDVGAGMTAAVLADVEVQAKAADAAVLAFGESLGGEVVSKMPIVQDAERGLIETRRGLAEESAALVSQEREVLAAREHLAKVEAQGGEVSKATSRKLEDAERKLSEARADGKADKIADAERNLSRAREDAAEQMAKSEEQNAREVQQARETVAKAETDLAEMRELSETAAKRLEAAERTVIAARYQAIADLSMSVGESFAKAAGGARDLFAALADQARIMEETRQRLRAEQIEAQTAALSEKRARLDLLIAEQDIARTRAFGAIAVADAEAALAKARDAATLKGQTGIDAMSRAWDRARTTGIFAVEDVAQSVVDNAASVRAAQHAVEAARAQADLDQLTAAHRQRLAVLDLAQATLTQQKAVALVDISTRQLAAQAAELGGLTAQGAQRASGGWGGLAQAGSGLGKLLGGLAGAAAGFAVGGPVGALIGGLPAIGGLFELLGGARQAWNNRDEIKQSWEGMDTMDKIIVGGGLLGGVAVAGGGAALSGQYGGEMAQAAAALGAELAAQSAGYAQAAIIADLERINSLAQEERDALDYQALLEQARIDRARWAAEMEFASGSAALSASVEIAELLGRIAEADTTAQADALAAAAIVAAERRDQMLDVLARQLNIAESQASAPRQQIHITLPASPVMSMPDVESLIDTIGRVQSEVDITRDTITGAEYLAARTT